jgi:predicted metal-dependent HD superfamily phosphohydrolase
MQKLTVLRKYWGELEKRLNLTLDYGWLFQDLVNAYNSEFRFYHNLDHLLSGLEYIAGLRDTSLYSPEVELAWWFHDAVYDPQASGNEAASAALLEQQVPRLEITPKTLARTQRLIMVTCHTERCPSKDQQAKLIVDVDLSILGRPVAVFDAYEVAVRKEYAHLDKKTFAEGRKAVLQSFQSRRKLYSTEVFRAKYEAQARSNIARSIKRLDKIICAK